MKRRKQYAFTQTELLAIILVASCLSFLAAPMLASNRSTTAAARCVSNFRHLALAFQLYTDDNNGFFPHNLHGGDANGGAGAFRFAPWASGWLNWSTGSDNTNTLFIRGERYARLAPYFRTPDNVHKCPSDVYLSASQKARGWNKRVRTAVMNASIGHVNLANIGPFDTAMYRRALSSADLIIPGPSETFVFTEEHPDSINDPLLFLPRRSSWIDLPASFHSGGATFSFADGHVELHSWRASLRSVPITQLGLTIQAVRTGDSDLHWVSYHSQRNRETSY